MIKPGPRNLITDVDGLRVGNAEDAKARTGTSVLLPDEAAVAAVDVRGGAPGTRETDALDPARLLAGRIDAIVLSGGSVYGLDAASGVVGWLGARGLGYQIPVSPRSLPIVPAAILFDMGNGGDKEWGDRPPYAELGRRACETAGKTFALGNAGAGYGAIAGSVKGGLGSVSAITEDGFQIGALMAVNAFGSTVAPGTDRFWAAPFELAGEFGGRGWSPGINVAALDPLAGSKADAASTLALTTRQNTTIGILATNAILTPGQAQRLAAMAHDGMARAIRPVHTMSDGDVIFVVSTGKRAISAETPLLDVARIASIGADCVARACARAVYAAESLGSAVSYRDAFPVSSD